MENCGIDIGSYKTVVSSSANTGTILYDKSSKRTIPTAYELQHPTRIFGNNLFEPSRKFKRNRNFSDISIKEQNEHLFAFINYLKQISPNSNHFTCSVPYFYGLKERRELIDLYKKADMNINVITDIVALGMLYNVKYEKSKNLQNFMIIDLGHEKTTACLFTKKENLEPVFIEGIKKGGKDFDIKLIDFIIKKYNIVDNDFSREKLICRVNKIKIMLNTLNDYKFNLEVGDDLYQITITKEEYLEIIKNDLFEFENFFDNLIKKASEYELNDSFCIEIVGGNSFNSYIKEIIDRKAEVFYSMNAEESCGMALGYTGALYKFGSKLNIKLCDYLPKEVFVRVFDFSDENVKNIFKSEELPKIDISKLKKISIKKQGSLLPTSFTQLLYKKKNNFIAEFIEGDSVIQRIYIYDIKGEIEINFQINKKGILYLEVNNASFSIEELDYDLIFENENKLKKIEDEAEKVANMRNELESVLMNLNVDLYSEEEKQILENIKEEMMYTKINTTINEENKLRKEISEKLFFITDKLKKEGEESKMKLLETIVKMESLVENNKSVYVKSLYKLQGLIYNARNLIGILNFDLFNIDKIKNVDVGKIISEMEHVKINVLNEIEEKKREDERKEKEKQEKEKQEEELKNKKEEKEEEREEGEKEEKEEGELEKEGEEKKQEDEILEGEKETEKSI